MLCILKAIALWFIMLIVGTTLIGLIVRGLLWSTPSIDRTTDRVREILDRESSRMRFTNAAMTLSGILIAAACLFGLFHFWNAGLALAGVIIMASRIPDLIWEVRNGRKPTQKERPKGTVYFLASTLLWATLVLVWYSLCEWKF
jgi:hypothetical protein